MSIREASMLTLDFCPWKIADSKIDPTARKFYNRVLIRAVRASIKHHAVGKHTITDQRESVEQNIPWSTSSEGSAEFLAGVARSEFH